MSDCWTVDCGNFSVDVERITKAGEVKGGGYRFIFRLQDEAIKGNFIAEKPASENGVFFPEAVGRKIYEEWLEYRDFAEDMRHEKFYF